MKKVINMMLGALLVFSLAACGSFGSGDMPESADSQTHTVLEQETEQETTSQGISPGSETGQVEEPAEDLEAAEGQPEQIHVLIDIGGLSLTAELYDTQLAKEFAGLLPQTISMQRVGGGREFYGSIDGSLDYDEADAQTTFENGDIAYWFSGNGLCLLYDNQVEKPEVESGIIIIGKITSDFSGLHNLDDHVTADISLADGQ